MSLRAQTYTLWEAIVVDDGSADSSSTVVERLQRNDDRIRLLRQGHSGVSAARNAGIAAAVHPWLLFLDADDTILPHHLERLTASLCEDPLLDAVYCGWRDINPAGEIVDHFPPYEPDLFSFFCGSCLFAIHTCIIRRSFVEQCGAFDPAIPFCEDWDLWQRVARMGARFGYVEEILAEYWLHADRDSGAKFLIYGIPTIERGHDRDLRVPQPAPQHAAGCPIDHQPRSVNTLVSWSAGLMLGNGRSCDPALASMRSSPGDLDPGSVAACFFHGVLRSRLAAPSDWRRFWPELMRPLRRLLLRMEWRSQCPGLAARTMSILESMVAAACAETAPITVGRVFAQTIDAGRPFQPVRLPGSCDRALFLIRYGETQLGTVELPVASRRLSRYLMSDAIANSFAWTVLGKYFEATLYPSIRSVSTKSNTTGASFSLFRDTTQIAAAREIPSPSALHDSAGWTILLQEVFGRPAWTDKEFYNPAVPEPPTDKPTRVTDRLIVEIGEALPDVVCQEPRFTIECRAGGIPVMLVAVDSAEPCVRGSEIRVKLLLGLGYELCRVMVREALLFRTVTGTDTLRVRLARARSERDAGGPLLSRDPREQSPDYIIGPRHDTAANPTMLRRFMLPRAPRSFIDAERRRSAIVTGPSPRRFLTEAVRCPELLCLPLNDSDINGVARDRAMQPRQNDAHAFDVHFSHGEDPWGYTNTYEKRKYEQTLSLLPSTPAARALEIGCAEGHFTEQLAPRVERLLAADISSIALQRAAARCSRLRNIDFRQLDIVKDGIDGNYDLITCSEVLYYIGTAHLADVARKMAQALAPGGALIMAHANVIEDEPDKPCFAWGAPFGALTIGRVFAKIEGLTFIRELQTPLYRIQHFQKSIRKGKTEPRIIRENHAEPLPHRLQIMVRHGGQEQVQAAPVEKIRTSELPVLMYHRIAEPSSPLDAPYCLRPEHFEKQIQHLSRAGFYSISLDEWGRACELRRPFPGRAVIITFDDGCLDFAMNAWPILRRYGFSAYVFLVTAAVGKESNWDPPGFPRVPLLSWSDIDVLHKEGVRFGSHTLTHAALDASSQRETVRQLTLSRIQLEDRLREAVTAVAFPFGAENGACRHLAGGAGYSYGLTTRSGRAPLHGDLLALPRITAPSSGDLASFLTRLEE
jgi:peptidoglycan/xylan/chitin deacetylase (PgdA/CDA1 family)/2-polyprenyl-3-methyl-5-hydroxy-6-metoxy-1,4-benzoquinol methylase